MNFKELAAALAERAAQDETLAPIASAAAKLSQDHDQILDSLAKAQDQADAVRYEDEIRAGKSERKITGPAHESRVRANFTTLTELQRYLAGAEPAPALSPEKPATEGTTPISAVDRQYLATLRKQGIVVDENEYARRKAQVR